MNERAREKERVRPEWKENLHFKCGIKGPATRKTKT